MEWSFITSEVIWTWCFLSGIIYSHIFVCLEWMLLKAASEVWFSRCCSSVDFHGLSTSSLCFFVICGHWALECPRNTSGWLSVGHFAIWLHCRDIPQRCLLWALLRVLYLTQTSLCFWVCVLQWVCWSGFSREEFGVGDKLASACWALMSRYQLLGRAGSYRLMLLISWLPYWPLWLVPGPNSWWGWMASLCLRAEASFDACLKTIAKPWQLEVMFTNLDWTLHVLISSTLLLPEQCKHRGKPFMCHSKRTWLSCFMWPRVWALGLYRL